MGYSVKERAERVGTFRWIAVQAMETLARWIPTTPEMEIKVLFGRHVWDFAQHADALGKRAFELRAPMQHSVPAGADYRAFLHDLAALESSADRVAAFYSGFIPGVAQRYRRYLSVTDTLMDEPTVRILERALFDFPRMQAERDRLAGGLALPPASIGLDHWATRAAAGDELAAAA
jgi:hypothetical protein